MRRRGRYGNVKKHVHEDGTKLDSGRELVRYGELLLLLRTDKIRELKVHPRYPIILGGGYILMKSKGYPNGRKLTYVADFSYLERVPGTYCTGWRPIIEDVKMQSGFRTEVYKIKRALMDAMGITISEY
jgi:hypothetical protein